MPNTPTTVPRGKQQGRGYDLAVGALDNQALLAHRPDRVRDLPLREERGARLGFGNEGLRFMIRSGSHPYECS